MVRAGMGMRCGGAAMVCAMLAMIAGAPTPATASERLFAADSVWNTPLPADAPLDRSSARRVDALADLVDWRRDLPRFLGGGHPNIAADAYSTPIHVVSADTPRVRVHVPRSERSEALRAALANGVPIPREAEPADGSNGHLTIYQPSSDTLWEFWRARKRLLLGWEAEWGGVMRDVSSNPGHYSAAVWPGLEHPDGWNWGSTATSLPVAAGTVTTEELREGRIDHALAMAVAEPCRHVFSWPAQRTDGTSYFPDCMPEGAHLRLDPALDVEALGLHPVAEQLALAAQRYGAIVRDRTRVSVSFYLESPPPDGPSPYTGPGGLYRGTPSWKVLEGFPWRSLRLLALTPCTSSPCPG